MNKLKQTIKEKLDDKLFDSASDNKYLTTKLLLMSGANPNTNKYDSYPLIMTKKKDIIENLIKHGADPNRQDYYKRTALIEAAKYRNKNAVKALIRHGANPFIRDYQNRRAIDHTSNLTVGLNRENRNILKKYMDVIFNYETKNLPTDIKRKIQKYLFSRKLFKKQNKKQNKISKRKQNKKSF